MPCAEAFQIAFCGLAGVVFCGHFRRLAQLQLGELSTDLSGVVSAGYSADYGNEIDSSHGLNLRRQCHRLRVLLRSQFCLLQSLTLLWAIAGKLRLPIHHRRSGVNLSTAIFSGSHFPGQISYAAAYNSEGQFAVPGTT